MNAKNVTDIDSWKMIGAKWLANQGPITVMFAALLTLLWYGGRYAMDDAIPKHLQAIQAGYDRQEASHTRALDRIIEAHNQSSQQLVEQMKESRDTFRESLEAGITRAIQRSKEP